MCVGFLYGEVTHPGIHFPRFNCDWQQVLPLLVFCFTSSCDNGRQMFFVFIHVLRCWIFINSTNNYVFVSSTGGETASKLMELLKQIQHVGRRDRMLIRTLCMNWKVKIRVKVKKKQELRRDKWKNKVGSRMSPLLFNVL